MGAVAGNIFLGKAVGVVTRRSQNRDRDEGPTKTFVVGDLIYGQTTNRQPLGGGALGLSNVDVNTSVGVR